MTGAAAALGAVLTTVLSAGLLAGCSGSPSPAARATGAASETSVATPSASPRPDAAARLIAVARVAARASYGATYALRTDVTGAAPSVVVVGIARPAARVALSGHGATALFIINRRGRFACERDRGRTACYRLADRGGRLPTYLDPGVEHVFLDYPHALAAWPGDYRVRGAPPTTAAPGVPAGDCFVVTARHRHPHGSVASGTYCYAPDGVLTAALFRSGRLVLTKVGGPPPVAAVTPPASATPLPTGP